MPGRPRLRLPFAQELATRKERLDLDLIERAFEFSAAAHRGQKRLSGDDYISHAVEVAKILVNQQLDSITIAAALLHDVVEDSGATIDGIREQFGNEIAGLVDGLTKISTLKFRSAAEEQSENYRKLLLSIARDAMRPLANDCISVSYRSIFDNKSSYGRRLNSIAPPRSL